MVLVVAERFCNLHRAIGRHGIGHFAGEHDLSVAAPDAKACAGSVPNIFPYFRTAVRLTIK
jgi:hypothetical protein